ncbi:hypothetical protein JHK82_015779 [Glycine max]|uniref:Uncharacterized protein n=2 Tax=Glycine subgen. Soja TaxID=1462606 RepID=A0A0R0JVC3_SOYBN|nr:hypothetical protein JHK87_015724 [Glycine soja]KAG5032193.1 hypothetical protein JHK85_016175 [Glycine max]KAG5046402.1 hypothetical protein JHK86_015808 [Glycine max]KAG5148898.1 hypothetical protein JHK82_015779 [Glycine max]KAH1126725.1 hypothetical protein GYH30_015649 [Glycine max]
MEAKKIISLQKETIFSSTSNLPRDIRRILESMKDQGRVALKPNVIPPLLLSHFKSNNSHKNLSKRSLLVAA